jgi:outer membrane protein assembly factor BamB
MRIILAASIVVLASPFAKPADPNPANWPQWRGPDRNGVIDAPAWPDKLGGEVLKQTWRISDLGPSYSGPIVASDRVFTTQTVDKKTEVVTAHDRKTGKELWRATWEGSITVPFFAAKNGSWIRSTPAYDGKTLYVAGIRDLLVALDGQTGKELWRVDFTKEFGSPPPDFGFVCSPLVDETGVYVQAGGCFVKLDKTGKILWRALKDGGGMMGSAFSSPVFARIGNVDQVVVQTRTKLAGVDRQTGAELWSREIPSFRGMNILTPLPVADDAVFTSTYGGNTRVVKIRTSDKKLIAEDGWSFKYEGYMTSPVVVDGHAYLLGKDRTLTCVDLKSGKEAWRSDERFGEYWSLVANKNKLLALDQRGTLYLFRANPAEFELLDKRKVADSETWAHLAVCGDELFIRDLKGLTAWRWSSK